MKGVIQRRTPDKTSFFVLCFSVFCIQSIHCIKHRYASLVECDRYSLDAIYYEKFKPITNNIFTDSKEFISRVSDSMADSLTTILAQLPDRDVSDNQERKVHSQFKALKTAFSSRIKKMHRNITSAWETLVTIHFDLMYDHDNSSLEDYLNKTLRVTEAYSHARTNLDSNMASFVGFVKSTIRDGLIGITVAAKDAIKKDKKNETKEKDAKTEKQSDEDLLRKKKLEITEMIASGFLGNLTVKVIERNMDLNKKVDLKPEDRDSVLDDVQFDLLMIKNRIRAIIETDFPKDKGAIDLARRSIYTYWADMAEEMYKEKMKAKEAPSAGGRVYYRKLWDDDQQLAETVLDLIEMYP